MFSIAPRSFDAPLPGNPHICINLILPETRVTGLHRHCLKCRSVLFRFSWWAPEDACVLKDRNRVHNGHSRSSKVVDFGTNRKHVCDFLLVFNSNLGPILSRFRDITGFLLRRVTPPLLHPNFGLFPLD